MMTQRTLGGIGVTAAGLIGVLVALQPAHAVTFVAFPTKALNYTTWMARAMEKCSPASVSVVSPAAPNDVPSSGCVQSNGTTTDNSVSPGATMNFAKLAVKKTVNHLGRITLFGRGFDGGQRMKVQLVMRVTKQGVQTKHPPIAKNNVTFEDFTVQCGNSPSTGCFTANINGAVSGSMSLRDCLTQNSQEPAGLANGNIQILDSALVNCDTGKIIATPGILN